MAMLPCGRAGVGPVSQLLYFFVFDAQRRIIHRVSFRGQPLALYFSLVYHMNVALVIQLTVFALVVSETIYSRVGETGNADTHGATIIHGVRPAQAQDLHMLL